LVVLNKVTFAYSSEEDRISVRGQMQGGGSLLLWMTQKLARQLVPHLRTRLSALNLPDVTQQVEQCGGDTPRGGADDLQSPVIYDEATPEYLIRSIDISWREAQLILAFHCEELHSLCVLGLSHDAAVQVIGALCQCAAKAGWPAHQGAFQVEREDQRSSEGVTIH
jgi:hypothetical protein